MFLIVCISLFASLYILSFFLPDGNNSTSYGSAQFVKKLKVLKRKNTGFLIGKKSLSANDSTQHALLCAPSGSGKTSLIIAKNIFHLLSKGHSMILTDPKLELTTLCSGWARDKMGIDVYVLNLQEPNKSITWNPLTSVKNNNFFGLVSDMYEITNRNTSTESIWKFGTIEILVSLCKVLAHVQNGKYLNLSNLLHLLQHLQAFPNKVKSWLSLQDVDTHTKLSIQRFLAQDEKVFGGILSGAVSVILAYIPDEIKALTHSTSLPEIQDFRTKQSLLILVLPIGREQVYTPYLNLILSHIFGEIMNTPISGSDKYIAGILEEFGQIYIPNYSAIVSAVRARRMMLLHCLQNIDQLTLRHGEQIAQIIANNCAHWLLLPSIKSKATLAYVRESLLGTATNLSDDRENRRFLLNNDEIRRLKSNTVLMISANLQPILIALKPLYKSWCLKRKYGLRNKDGQLISSYPCVEHADSLQSVEYVDFDSIDAEEYKGENEQAQNMKSFLQRLEETLPRDKK